MGKKIRKLKSYFTFGKNWIINFLKARKGREDYFPLYFIWTTLRTCNFTCVYCDDHQGKKYPDLDNAGVLSTQQGIQLLKSMRTGTSSVYYAGGEPTLRNDLPVLMKSARELGYYPQVINTNGSVLHKRLQQPEWRTFLSDIDIIVVSLDSLDPAVLSKMYQTTQPENVIRNILALRNLSNEFDFKLMINCVVQPGYIKDAHDVLNFANDYGIYFSGVPVNVGPKAQDGLLSSSDYQTWVSTLLGRHKNNYKFAGSYRLNERLYHGASDLRQRRSAIALISCF